jgi:hypothetical protein
LRAYTHDIDGDDLSLDWSGPGLPNQNDANKTAWDAADTGPPTVSCVASDGAGGRPTRAFSVGAPLGGDASAPSSTRSSLTPRIRLYVMTAEV